MIVIGRCDIFLCKTSRPPRSRPRHRSPSSVRHRRRRRPERPCHRWHLRVSAFSVPFTHQAICETFFVGRYTERYGRFYQTKHVHILFIFKFYGCLSNFCPNRFVDVDNVVLLGAARREEGRVRPGEARQRHHRDEREARAGRHGGRRREGVGESKLVLKSAANMVHSTEHSIFSQD